MYRCICISRKCIYIYIYIYMNMCVFGGNLLEEKAGSGASQAVTIPIPQTKGRLHQVGLLSSWEQGGSGFRVWGLGFRVQGLGFFFFFFLDSAGLDGRNTPERGGESQTLTLSLSLSDSVSPVSHAMTLAMTLAPIRPIDNAH